MCVVQRPLLGFLCGPWLWVSLAQPPSRAPTRQSPPSPNLHFRLAGYPRKHNEGRVEVFYNQEWGTICDDDFTLANAHILCRHLGFVAATGWTHSAKYGKGVGEHHWDRDGPPKGRSAQSCPLGLEKVGRHGIGMHHFPQTPGLNSEAR